MCNDSRRRDCDILLQPADPIYSLSHSHFEYRQILQKFSHILGIIPCFTVKKCKTFKNKKIVL